MSVEADAELIESMRQKFITYGEIQEDGKSLLEEVAIKLDGFRVSYGLMRASTEGDLIA